MLRFSYSKTKNNLHWQWHVWLSSLHHMALPRCSSLTLWAWQRGNGLVLFLLLCLQILRYIPPPTVSETVHSVLKSLKFGLILLVLLIGLNHTLFCLVCPNYVVHHYLFMHVLHRNLCLSMYEGSVETMSVHVQTKSGPEEVTSNQEPLCIYY